jgi:pimeloyl-ACP methyl ester carboxylesterase
VDIGPTSEARGMERIQREVQGVPEEFDSFDAVVEYMGKQNTYASDEVLRRRLRYATRELANGKIGWKYDMAIRQQRRQDTPAPLQQDMWPVAQSIPCPTLIVRGTETDLLSPETAKRMVDTMPNAQLVEVQRAGHMVFEDNPDGFLEAIGPFL